jgi:hypothetical protein
LGLRCPLPEEKHGYIGKEVDKGIKHILRATEMRTLQIKVGLKASRWHHHGAEVQRSSGGLVRK